MVAGLEVSRATVRYGDTVAIQDVSIAIAPGEVLALLGPSGSGKSTLLRAIAGLEPLVSGRVSWDGDDLAAVPTHKRGFGMVFQDGQLFPTMSVGRNIAYGLSHLGREAQRARVDELLDLVGLPGLAQRRPTELSGGQAQRVALARSLAPGPRALLLDEPLSALDPGLRRRLSDDLARILRETGTTAVYVTHDPEEADRVADRTETLSPPV
ncbi:MAG: ABC transporter ATP-binding protein [Arachnia sp.]